MKTETKTVIVLFLVFLIIFIAALRLTPTREQQDEADFQQCMDDTSQLMHSEIKMQELGETYLYYRAIEPHFLNNEDESSNRRNRFTYNYPARCP